MAPGNILNCHDIARIAIDVRGENARGARRYRCLNLGRVNAESTVFNVYEHWFTVLPQDGRRGGYVRKGGSNYLAAEL